MDTTTFDDESIRRNLPQARTRVAQIRRRRRAALAAGATTAIALAGSALLLRDPAPVELETVDPEPTTTVAPPSTVTTSIPSATTTTATATSPTTEPSTTVAPLPPPVPSTVPPTTAFVPSAFVPDRSLARTRERLLAVGDGWVEVEAVKSPGGRKRLVVAPDVRLGLLVSRRPCCAAMTVASLSDLRIGVEYWFGNSNPSENFHYPIGEPIREIVELIPETTYEGMRVGDAERVASEVQGLLVKTCDVATCNGGWEFMFDGSAFIVYEDGIVVHVEYPT
jgi:hypothetical protein